MIFRILIRIEGRHESFARRGDDYVDAFTMARVSKDAAAAGTDADIITLVGRLQPSRRQGSVSPPT